jgi:integrase
MASIEHQAGRKKPFRVRTTRTVRDPTTGHSREVRGSASFRTRGEAEEFARGCEVVEQDRRRSEAVRSGKLVRAETVASAIERHLGNRRARGLVNVDDDELRANRLVRDIGDVPLAELTRGEVRRWKYDLETTPSAKTGRLPAPQTVKNLLNLLRTALAEAVERGEIDVNPAADVRAARDTKERKAKSTVAPLSFDEFKRVVAQSPRTLGLFVTFAVYTGLRQGEMWSLRHEDLVERDGMRALLVRRGHLDGRSTKTGHERVVPLLPEAAAALDEWLAVAQGFRKRHGELIFCTERGAPLPQGKPPRGWFEVLDACGIARRVRWHDLRHTCGTWLAAGTIGGRAWSLHEVRDFLGHSQVQTTERYAHRREETLLRAVRETAAAASARPPRAAVMRRKAKP